VRIAPALPAMLAPYSDDPKNIGNSLTGASEKLKALASSAKGAGFNSIPAIG